MDSHEPLFTAGQFAQLHNINKRTLHFYDDIGLFSPSHKGKNGYRYYSYRQSTTLEMLLTLRELDMSIKEIESYMKNRSAITFRTLIKSKTAEIDDHIKRLREIRKLLAHKENQLAYCEQADIDCIEIVECKEEYLLASKAITGAYDDNDFAVLVKRAQALNERRLFNKTNGSMLSVEKIMNDNFDDYDFFFTKAEKPNKKSDLFIRQAGKYVRVFCKGDWDKLPDAYRRAIAFAENLGMTPTGYAFEDGINEMPASGMEEYVTQIMIRCE